MDAIDTSPSIEGLQKSRAQIPTAGELMRSVSQSVQRFYREELDHKTERVTCNLVADKLIIWIEGSVNSVTRLLRRQSAADIQSLHDVLQQVIHQRVATIVENQLQVKVITLVSDTCYEKECTGLIVWLSALPTVRVAKGPMASGRKASSAESRQSQKASS